ncbi:MAG: DegT/DnrJ/EryC1/StrS family aminotransferase [Acidobacteriota bacterium]
MQWRYPLCDLTLDEAEIAAVADTLRSGWLTMGPQTEALEAEFAALLGIKHAIAVANGTAALQLAYHLLDIREKQEAIMPSLTFVATANALVVLGGRPRFVDIASILEPTIDPVAIEAAITASTRAIVIMHYGGYACRMEEIIAIARKYNLAVIEDCAHAPGAELQGRKLGTFGTIGCFSFFSNKNLTTGEGGMLVTENDELAARARLLRSHGMTRSSWARHQQAGASYDVLECGYNFRLDEMRATLGRIQLHRLISNNARRRYLSARYRSLLATVSNVVLPFQKAPERPACHLMPILVPSATRARVVAALAQRGIQTSIHYRPVHSFTAYRDEREMNDSLLRTNEFAARELTLPLYPDLPEEAIDEIAAVIGETLANQP